MQRFCPVSSMNEADSERQITVANQAAKPLPPFSRGWSRICHETGLFLRGIGLGIIVTACQGFFTKTFFEPEKFAIRRSRTTALPRTLIHIGPLGVTVFEIILNVKGRFVGTKQSYLQFAAKAHGNAIQASTATILSKSVIFAAATAGPSSASLLIAQQGLWPSTSLYVAEPLRFARADETLPGKLSQSDIVNDIVSITGLTKVQVVQNVSGENFGFLVNWEDLPLDIFNTIIPGAVVVNAQDQSGSFSNIKFRPPDF
ncbi:hypothetical protein MMC29_001458 [Sticta canariensis]|nr:hypothetical protein [Sticta canariensis]